MRVLLPLRKVAANKQSSNSSLSDFEEEEGYREEEAGEILTSDTEHSHEFTAAAFPQEHQTSLSASPVACQHQKRAFEYQLSAVPQAKVSVEAASQTAGLKQAATFEPQRTFSPLGKRKAVVDEADLKLCKKRPALDRKPPARDLGTMVAPGRTWLYRSNEDRRDAAELVTTDPLQSSPASARGDMPTADDVDIDFVVALQKHGLEIREQDGDGNCLFRAISLQVYGDPSMHTDVRKQCMDFMVRTDISNTSQQSILVSCLLP
jgi:hypothetical protein